MGLLHVLLAVALPLGLIRAVIKETSEHIGIVRMSVVHMAVPFLLGGPTDFVEPAVRFGAFIRTCMRLFVFTGVG